MSSDLQAALGSDPIRGKTRDLIVAVRAHLAWLDDRDNATNAQFRAAQAAMRQALDRFSRGELRSLGFPDE